MVVGVGGTAALFFGYHVHQTMMPIASPLKPLIAIARGETSDQGPDGDISHTAEANATAKPAETTDPAEEPPPPEPDARASKPELDAAIADGPEALTTLSTTYPKDPRVLHALALALAKERDRTSELLRVVDSLFSAEPASIDDTTISRLVKDAALQPSTSARAIELMQSRMGQTGADMLFDIVLNQPDYRERARAAFETSEVQRNLSPALRVAYDLYTAPTCSARLGMLPAVGKEGDQRADAVIVMQTQKSKKGCGPRRDKPCPPACAKDLAAYDATLRQIRLRTAAAPGR